MQAFRRACAEGRVTPVPALLLRSAMAEARTISDSAGNAKLSKSTQGGRRLRARDDAAAAALLAVAEGVRRPAGLLAPVLSRQVRPPSTRTRRCRDGLKTGTSCAGTATRSRAEGAIRRPPDMVRPRKPEAERRSRTICVRATTAEAATIAERAGAARLTKGAYIRRRALGSRSARRPFC